MSLSEAPGAPSIDDILASAATLCDLFQGTAARAADDVALRTVGGGTEITWGEYAQRVESIASGLAKLGVERGDAVAIMMTNRPEFSLVDCAAMHLGATPFSVYNTLPADEVAFLFGNAGNDVVVFQESFADVVKAAAEKHGVEHLVCIDGEVEGAITLDELEAAPADGFDFEASWRAVQPDDVLTLIYTSGTTGPSKGVELTHKSMMAELKGMAEVLPLQPQERTISFLPHAHIADRWATYYSHMVHGGTVTSISDPTQLLPALHEVRPTIWGAVPRIWEKFKAALDAGIAAEEDPQKKAGIEKALEVGHQYQALKREGKEIPVELEAAHAKLDEMVLSQLRAKIGLDQVRWIVVGAAPSPIPLLEFFNAIGLKLVELWGMSEISCCAIVNPPEANRLGTVGKAIPGVEVRTGEDGELQVRGDIVMKGYRDEPQKTKDTFTDDGWLMTGDIVEISDDGYVKIVDRKKELIINAAGKNMSPSNIEAHLKSSHALIGQAIAIGDGRPYNVALLVLDPDAVAAFAAKAGLSGDDATPAAVAERDDVKAAVAGAVEEANSHLARVEQIKRYAILGDEWQPGGTELTPTMKLKRKPINEKYQSEIEELYA